MSDALVAVQARVAELRGLLGLNTPAQATSAGGSSGFAAALASALADGTLGTAGGTATSGSSATTALSQLADLANQGGSSNLTGLQGLTRLTGTGTGQGSVGTLGERAVALAATFNGVPYKWGGTDPASGLDCSGLVQRVYRTLGATLPRVAADQSHAGTAVPSLDAAQPGDLVFFGRPAHHVGIYVGNGTMIDAPHTGSVVGIHKLWGTPSSIRRITPDDAVSTAAVAGSASGSTGSTGSAAAATTVAAVTDPGAPVATSQLSGPFAELFTQAGRRYGVDPTLLSAMAKAESGYNPRAVSPAGAQGLMQLMPGTAKGLGVNAYDPAQAVDGAARMVRDLLRQFDGHVDLAVAAYNAGPGAVQRYGGIPPYRETRNYVQHVLGYQEALR